MLKFDDETKFDWQVILPKFGIPKDCLKKKHGPCPICEGKDRFRFDNKNNMGTYFCQKCGPGNVMTLLRKYTGKGDAEILKDIEDYSGSVGTSVETPIARTIVSDELTAEEIAENRKKLVAARRAAVALQKGDPVSTYLLDRVPGLDLSKISKEILHHKGMKFYEYNDKDENVCRGVFPVMLARVVDGQNKPITLHRTYLTKDGKKAPFDMVKKQMAGIRKLKGAAIRLNDVPSSRVLGVCEGIETGLAIVTAYRFKMPVWSLLNCVNLAVADIPKGMFDKVIIFADHDRIDPQQGYRPGTHYAELLKQKLEVEGFEVEIRMPPEEGKDFNDMWVEYVTRQLMERYAKPDPEARISILAAARAKSREMAVSPVG